MEFQSVMKKSLCVSLIIFSLTSLTFSQNIINDGGGDAPRDSMCMLYLGEGTVRVIVDQKSKITLPKTVPPGTTIEELMATAIGIGIIRLGLDISDELVKAVLTVMDAHPDFTPAEIVREVEVFFVNQEKINLAKDGATPEPFDL